MHKGRFGDPFSFRGFLRVLVPFYLVGEEESPLGHNPPSDRRKWARLRDWAADGRCIRVRCNLCKRTLHFYAADLVTVYDPEMIAADWRPPCSHCKKSDWVSVRSFFPGPDDVGRIMMRRPAGVRRIQLWKSELYGPPTEAK